jgi:hypothetical protein
MRGTLAGRKQTRFGAGFFARFSGMRAALFFAFADLA